MDLDYRIISDDEILLVAHKVNITFLNCNPADKTQLSTTLYANIADDIINQYDGFFMLSINPLKDKGQKELEEIFNILLNCEKENKNVTIDIKYSFSPEQNLPVADFTTILNNVKLSQVAKIIRSEKNEYFSSTIFMLYNN